MIDTKKNAILPMLKVLSTINPSRMRAFSSRIVVFLLLCFQFSAFSQTRLNTLTIDFLKESLDYSSPEKIKNKVLTFQVSDQIYAFYVSQNDVPSPELEMAYPDIKTYQLKSVNKNKSEGALTIYQDYANLMIDGDQGHEIWISKPDHPVFTKSQKTNEPHVCGLNDKIRKASQVKPKTSQKITNIIENGDFKRRYRLAIVTTGEFYTMNGNNNGMVTATVTASVNNLQAIYNEELAINFQLLNPFLYTNPDTDPFTPDEAGGDDRVTQAVAAVTQQFNTNAYDIGQVLNQNVANDDWSGGGLAYLEAVCDDGINIELKAGGWSSSFNANGFQFIQIFAHEVAHMFGAEHTFNGDGDSCDDAISETTAYEIGSGTTIMSYDGTCADDQNIPSNEVLDDYFHAHSITQMINYINGEGDCGQMITTNNTIPEVEANPCNISWEIPQGTAFYLSGEATDADGDNLTYSWEQYDEDGDGLFTQGFIGNAAANSPIAPLFRSFPPSPDNFRYFPQLEDVLNDFNDPFEVLPNVFRTMNFRFSVRDNNPDGGAIAQDEIAVTVSDSGPFVITSPNGSEDLQAGDNIPITWDTGGSDALCDMVSIFLSLDGGLSFPVEISSSTAYNSGNFSYTLPVGLNNTEQARIKITCVDNSCYQFFDLSDQGFAINSFCEPDFSSLCDVSPLVVDAGDPALNLNLENIKGDYFARTELNITNSSPTSGLAISNFGSTGCVEIVDSRSTEFIVFNVSEDGLYTFIGDCDFQNSSTILFSVFEDDNFNASNPCSSFVGSSGRQAMAGGTSAFCSDNLSVELEACKNYRVHFWSFGLNPQRVVMNFIQGPGLVYFNDTSNPDYAYTYVVIDPADGTIRGHDPDADFTNLFAGTYHIYGLSYKSGGTTPPMDVDVNSLIGGTLIDAAESANCILASANFKPVTIETSCVIGNINLGDQTACDPINNTFTQEVIITYDLPPTTGMLTVNDMDYPITGSPQTITLTFVADGTSIDIEASFTEDNLCANLATNLVAAPVNCCPIDIPIMEEVTLCDGGESVVNAGTDGTSYLWIQGTTTLSETSNVLTITETGNYQVVVVNADGCLKRQNFTAVSESAPQLDAIDDFDLCNGLSTDVSITTTGTSIIVSKDNNPFATNETVLEITESGTYNVIVMSTAGCVSEEQFMVSLVDPPVIDLGDDRVACIGGSVDLFAGVMADAYAWTQMGSNTVISNTDQLTVTAAGTYILTATNAGFCSSEDQVDVTFEPGPTLDISDDLSLCEGDTGTLIATTNGTSIQWLFNNMEIPNATDFELDVTITGTYTAQVFGTSNCEVSVSAMVEVFPNPEFMLDGDQVICEGDEYELTVDSGNATDSYEYLFNDTPINNIPSSTTSITIDEAGTYEVIVTSENDCTSSESIMLSVIPEPTVEISGSATLCDGAMEILTATSNAGAFEWYLDGTLLTQTTPNITIDQAGTYRCVALAGNDCFAEDEFIVTAASSPSTDLGIDQTLCPGGLAILDAGVHDSYLWSDNSSQATLDVTAPSSTQLSTETYTVTVTNTENCEATDEITITFLPTITGDITASANGVCIDGSIDITASGGTTYSWDNSDGTLSGTNTAMVTATPSMTSMYTVTITDNCPDNEDIQTINVEVFDGSAISAGLDTCIIIGDEYTLNATGGVNYDWDNESTIIGNDDIRNPVVAPEITTIYTVEIIDANGCTFTDDVEICVLEDPLSLFQAVSIITPNDDGKNDALRFPGLDNFPENKLVIFNRWGNLIYEQENYQQGDDLWNATRRGERLPPDTYFYVLTFGENTIKSSITVVYD